MIFRLFVETNAWNWNPRPSIDEAEKTVVAIASGEFDEQATADWLRRHLAQSEPA